MADDHLPHALPDINIGDPLYRLLADRLGLRLGHVIGLQFLLNVVQVVIIPVLHHRRLHSNLLTNLNLQDIELWLGAFISQPLILYVYWRLVTVVPNVFVTLHDNRVIKARGHRTVAQFLLDLEMRMTARRNNVVTLVVVGVALVMFNLIGWRYHRFSLPFGSYPYNDFQQYVLFTIYGFFRFTFFGWVILRSLIFIDGLRDWWDAFEVDSKPFHPDGAGGLSAVGNTTWLSGLVVGSAGLFIGSAIVLNVESNLGSVQLGVLLILVALALLIGPLAFFLPIWSTHRAMLEARDRRLQLLSERFNAHWEAIYSSRGADSGAHAEQLAHLMRLREVTLKVVPTWPFGNRVFGRFSLSLTPLWTVGVYVLMEVIFPNVLSSILGLGYRLSRSPSARSAASCRRSAASISSWNPSSAASWTTAPATRAISG